jgi:MFS family permease
MLEMRLESAGPERRARSVTGVTRDSVLVSTMFIATMVEGVVGSWSGAYLTRELGASPTAGAVSVAVFFTGVGVARLFGDPITARIGNRWLMRFGSLMAAAVALTVPFLRDPTSVIAAFGVLGLGLGNAVPLVVRAASRGGAAALATVQAWGADGILLGPPIAGIVAGLFGLPTALSSLCALIGVPGWVASAGPFRED